MDYQTLISPEELHQHLGQDHLAVMDCRFYLTEPDRGLAEYLEGHIPGAVYVNLDRDLAGKVIPGVTGRHPLPPIEDVAERFSAWGVDQNVQVVAYDNLGGALAARLWWMLRWLGHEKAAVLNGGWDAWVKGGFAQNTHLPAPQRRTFIPREHPDYIADIDLVDRIRLDPDFLLVDARSAERFWGLKEDIDFRAGHIPGAVSAPYSENLDTKGYFLSPDQLRERYDSLLGDIPEENVIVYCGSGVTSIHNMIAMLVAGYKQPRLYPGSWSEWSADPDRPVGP
jgi:thiosulfate/3-mercaptopyruvate sulfurtransferase